MVFGILELSRLLNTLAGLMERKAEDEKASNQI